MEAIFQGLVCGTLVLAVLAEAGAGVLCARAVGYIWDWASQEPDPLAGLEIMDTGRVYVPAASVRTFSIPDLRVTTLERVVYTQIEIRLCR